MDKLLNFLDAKVLPVANVIGSQRHMMAIRKGLIATMPLIIVGSFFTLLLNIPACSKFSADFGSRVPNRY